MLCGILLACYLKKKIIIETDFSIANVNKWLHILLSDRHPRSDSVACPVNYPSVATDIHAITLNISKTAHISNFASVVNMSFLSVSLVFFRLFLCSFIETGILIPSASTLIIRPYPAFSRHCMFSRMSQITSSCQIYGIRVRWSCRLLIYELITATSTSATLKDSMGRFLLMYLSDKGESVGIHSKLWIPLQPSGYVWKSINNCGPTWLEYTFL